MEGRRRLGVIVRGSLREGLTARLEVDPESLRRGSFVVAEGGEMRYFSLISDLRLEASDPKFQGLPADGLPDYVRRSLDGIAIYATAELTPYLMLDKEVSLKDATGPRPVRTIPSHFSAVYEASDLDFLGVFGTEGGKYFRIGTPPDQNIPICLALDHFTQRSSGIFGQTGTGKSFLARILLAGIIQWGEVVNLVFDMHNEYAFEVQTEDKGFVKGLRDLFGSKVAVCALGEQFIRGRPADFNLLIGMEEVEPRDLELLAEEFNLTSTAPTVMDSLYRRYGQGWLSKLLSLETKEELEACSEETQSNYQAFDALWRKLSVLRGKDYLRPEVPYRAVEDILLALEKGQHIILEFGQYDDLLDYTLVANIFSRRIYQRWRERTEEFYRTKRNAPKHLLITLEEAHKFLSPAAAKQTIFGTIAREMRKYNVTLMVIDQRPSGIDDEVLSQLGTRVAARLADEADIEAVLTAMPRRMELAGIMAGLEDRQQVLLMGHGVPMPVVVSTRPYDAQFYKDLQAEKVGAEKFFEELYGRRPSSP